MTLRAISGVIVSRGRPQGNVTFNFSDHRCTPGYEVAEIQDTDPNRRRFRTKPCKVVSLREIKVVETDEAWPTGRPETIKYAIGDNIDEDWITVEWQTITSPESENPPSQIEEISFMVIGETV